MPLNTSPLVPTAMPQHWLAALKKSIMFSHLDNSGLIDAEKLAERCDIGNGELLFSESDITDCIWVLVEGSVQFFVTDGESRRLINATANAGATPGIVSYIDRLPSENGCMAFGDCVFLKFTRDTLSSFFGAADGLPSCPRIRGVIMHRLVQIVRGLTRQTRRLALMDVYTRMRALLLALSEEEGGYRLIPTPLTQQQIADMVGSSREMIAKILKELRTGNYIHLDERRIVISRELPVAF